MKELVDLRLVDAEGPMDDATRVLKFRAIVIAEVLKIINKEGETL